ncbi:MAG: hypothetical protein MK106_07970 [Mariniblastus sp.]|nr:hypothetical protein [Mariniblastus sp.]
MDRKTEIDRYMMAGPFSNPQIIQLLNREFIPVRSKPKTEQQKKYDLAPFQFIEPGFLILEGSGDEQLKVDRLTTFQSEWLFQLISSASGKAGLTFSTNQRLAAQWAAVRSGNWDFTLPSVESDDPDATEIGLLRGMQAFRNNQPEKAKRIFAEISVLEPTHPLAWKAAAESEGFGPFVRGFEIFRSIPSGALTAGVDSQGSSAPKGVFNERGVWLAGTDFLLGMQNESGGFVDSDYDFGGTDSLPNVHVAVTALVGMALLESKEKYPEHKTAKVDKAIRDCFRFVSDPKNINRSDRDEILWAYAFPVRLMARMKRLGYDTSDSLQKAVENLQSVQSKRGGWYHEYENPFVTATALCSLHEAKQAGAVLDMQKVSLGVKALSKDRQSPGTFPYSSGGRRKVTDGSERELSAAAGRMPLCEVALSLWGESDLKRLQNAIQQSFRYQENLDVALKYDDHTSRLAYGGFFFWYDMRGRSEAISNLMAGELKSWCQAKQKGIIMAMPEIDGCFVDSHEIGRCYGTAMALLCLARSDADTPETEK